MRRVVAMLMALAILSTGCAGAPVADAAEARDPDALGEPDGAEGLDGGGTVESGPPSIPDRLAFADPRPTSLRLSGVRPDITDPRLITPTDQVAVVVADLLYDGLTEYHPESGELGPALAQRWAADDDLDRWTFELDPSAPVSADEVVQGLRTLDAGPAGTVALAAAGIVAVEAPDAATVVVDLSRPNGGLPWLLSGLTYSVMGPDGSPTGSYRVVRDDEEELVLAGREDASDQPPDRPLEEIRFVWDASPAAAYDRLTLGRADGVFAGPEELVDARLRFGADPGPLPVSWYVIADPRRESMSDVAVRQAVLASIDRDDQRALLGGDGASGGGGGPVLALDGLSSAGLAGRRPNTCGAVCNAAETSALSIAADAAPIRVGALTGSGDGLMAAAEAIVGDLRAADIGAEVVPLTAEELVAATVDGGVDLYMSGWAAPGPSIDGVVPPLLRADSPASIVHSSSNTAARLLDEAAATGHDSTRWRLLGDAERLVLAEALILPIGSASGSLVLAPSTTGVILRPDGSLDL